jgi:DNA (cytosine-5)-methyltransferase 1
MNDLRLIDTFSGIGGFSYAAEKLVGGYKTVAFVECEPYCQKVLKKHWPKVPIHEDIKTYKPKTYSADVICGGFPCQDISQAGKGKGITQETRSGLFFELMRVVCLVRPKFIVLENVGAILNNGLDVVLKEISKAGYDAEWATFPASLIGACHKRERWWLIAYPSVIGMEGRGESRKQIKFVDVQEKIFKWSYERNMLSPEWRGYTSKPVLRRGDDGLSNRIHRLKALGNSIVPQVAAIPLQRVKELSYHQSSTF